MAIARSVTDEHRYLYHYTTAMGLHGIITSQQLWATQAAYLNDSEEITGFFDRRLPRLLEGTVNSAVTRQYESTSGRDHINSLGGIEQARADLLRDVTTAIRKATMSFNQPYVTSFCSAIGGKSTNDGLLSQWRGYGTDGGYAIVFESSGLETLLNEEIARFQYQFGLWGDVDYYDENSNATPIFPETAEWENTVRTAVSNFLSRPGPEHFEPLLEAITSLSTRHKHRGFSEEREVRIIALPSNKELLEAAMQSGDNRPRKSVRFVTRDGVLVPYIALFERKPDEAAVQLPIEQIIVGPHAERLKRKQSVELLLDQCGIAAKVIASDIPYLGR